MRRYPLSHNVMGQRHQLSHNKCLLNECMSEFVSCELRPLVHRPKCLIPPSLAPPPLPPHVSLFTKCVIWNLHFWGGRNSKGRSTVLLRTRRSIRKNKKASVSMQENRESNKDQRGKDVGVGRRQGGELTSSSCYFPEDICQF